MKIIKQNVYLYKTNGGYTSSTTEGMDVAAGWLLIDTKEVEFEVDEDLIKQKGIDAILAKQESLNAQLVELTS